MIESVVFWNEPNNHSHWNRQLDPDWACFARMVALAAARVRETAPGLTRVLGGISPLDAGFITLMDGYGALRDMDVVSAHGFPLDWNRWHIDEWPERLSPIQAAGSRRVWVTEVGASTIVDENLQTWAIDRTRAVLPRTVERAYWYALMDLPEQWAATTRHANLEGEAYYRHYRMGVADARGTLKPAAAKLAAWAEKGAGVCEWVYWREERRLAKMVQILKQLGIRRVRTGIGWADWERPGGIEWFDHVMSELAPFDLSVTLCFTPAGRGVEPHHTSPPVDISDYVRFCESVVERYRCRR
jgi:beta-xylosidase